MVWRLERIPDASSDVELQPYLKQHSLKYSDPILGAKWYDNMQHMQPTGKPLQDITSLYASQSSK